MMAVAVNNRDNRIRLMADRFFKNYVRETEMYKVILSIINGCPNRLIVYKPDI